MLPDLKARAVERVACFVAADVAHGDAVCGDGPLVADGVVDVVGRWEAAVAGVEVVVEGRGGDVAGGGFGGGGGGGGRGRDGDGGVEEVRCCCGVGEEGGCHFFLGSLFVPLPL